MNGPLDLLLNARHPRLTEYRLLDPATPGPLEWLFELLYCSSLY